MRQPQRSVLLVAQTSSMPALNISGCLIHETTRNVVVRDDSLWQFTLHNLLDIHLYTREEEGSEVLRKRHDDTTIH